MKKLKYFLYFPVFILLIAIGLSGAEKSTPGSKYRNWLEKDAAYIITPAEKKVFNLLKTDREREIFIQMFWNHRDPDEHTVENEFKTEHYRRIKHANHHFGRGTPTPGWKTEMGRIYIILGEPNQVQSYEHTSGIYPVVIWFYQGMNRYGLPEAFNVVFFKQYGAGDFELYSPVKHGPSSLMVHYQGDINDYLSQYRELHNIQKEVADVCLTLIDGERNQTIRPSVSSDILVHKKIKEMPSKKLDDQYASKMLQYKEFISMDHSAKYIRSSSLLKVIRDNQGHHIVHYLVEPQRLSMAEKDGRLVTDLLLNGSITDLNNRIVFNFEKTMKIELSKKQANNAGAKLFAVEDSFPLIPGEFRINLLLRNRLSKEFTSFEKNVHIFEKNSPFIGDLFLGNRIRKSEASELRGTPFTKKGMKFSLSPRNDFIPGQTMHLFFQILNGGNLQDGASVTYSISGDKGGKQIGRIPIDPHNPQKDIIKEISLQNLRIDYYSIRVELLDKDGKILDSGTEDFYISPNRNLKRAWAVSCKRSDWENEKHSILGIQYSNQKQYNTALKHLRKAYFKNPSVMGTALNYASVLFKAKKYREIISVGEHFRDHREKHKFYTLMALANHALQNYPSAIEYYKKYISYYGENIHVLRSLEQCYKKTGDMNSAGAVKTRLDSLPGGSAEKSDA